MAMSIFPDFLKQIRTHLAREQRVLLLFLAIAGLAGSFAAISDEMKEGETAAFDKAVTYLFRVAPDHVDPIGPGWLPGVIIDITALGSVAVLTLVTMLAIAFLLVRGRWRQGLLVAFAISGGALASKALKALFARPRPDLVPHLVDVNTLSFPSGHATNSAIVYLTLAILVARTFTEAWTRAYILFSGILLTIMIGITRVYLGVHYPSDVIAGWTAGGAWALVMSALARILQQKHQIEPPQVPGRTRNS